MASIKDAIEETITDKNSIIKFCIYAIPPFLCTEAILTGNNPNSGLLLIGLIVTSILLLGYMLKCTMNVSDDSSHIVLPSFNIFGVFFTGLVGAIVLAPIAIIVKIVSVLCIGLLATTSLPPNMILIFSWIIYFIFGSFIYTSYLLYSRHGKAFEAYNLSAISKYCIDILIGVIFMKLLIALADIILILPIGYIIWLFLGMDNPISVFILCTIAIFNLSVMAHYMAQLGYEVIAVAEEKSAEEKHYEQLEKERLAKIKSEKD